MLPCMHSKVDLIRQTGFQLFSREFSDDPLPYRMSPTTINASTITARSSEREGSADSRWYSNGRTKKRVETQSQYFERQINTSKTPIRVPSGVQKTVRHRKRKGHTKLVREPIFFSGRIFPRIPEKRASLDFSYSLFGSVFNYRVAGATFCIILHRCVLTSSRHAFAYSERTRPTTPGASSFSRPSPGH